jgi:argininosuccinate synthase
MRFDPHGLLTSLDAVKRRSRNCVLLYSGGIDSSYFLWWAQANSVAVTALEVGLSGGGADPAAGSEKLAGALGADYRHVEATAEFARDYVARAINADARYQGVFPVSSSLSRPLMATKAVAVARETGADTVVHTAGPHQNSCARFNNSLRVLAPDLLIGNPFLDDNVPRAEKLAQLMDAGMPERSIYSVDQNIWARVIENGELDSVASAVPEHVFVWTRSPLAAPREELVLDLEFRMGLPVAVNGEPRALDELVLDLNERAGRFGVGRFNGVEDTALGVKNHEVREAPGAAVILAARKHLEQVTLTAEELRVKHVIDGEWTGLAVRGGWYSDLARAMGDFVQQMSRPVTGVVGVTLGPGSAFVSRVAARLDMGTDSALGMAVMGAATAANVDTISMLSRSVLES